MPTTYEPIATTTLTTATDTVTFSSISSSYTDLVLVCGNVGAQTAVNAFKVQVGNGSVDTGNNYSCTFMYGDSTATAARQNNESTLRFLQTPPLENNQVVIHFLNYKNTTTYKTVLSRSIAPDYVTSVEVNTWRSTSAINTMRIFWDLTTNKMVAGTVLSLYGITAA